jgi:predicted flap endonuclease-1-like 5' DNA nuclease
MTDMVARFAALVVLLVTGLAQTACSVSSQPAGKASDNNVAILALIVLALAMVLVWLWQRGRQDAGATPQVGSRPFGQAPAAQPPAPAPVRAQVATPAAVAPLAAAPEVQQMAAPVAAAVPAQVATPPAAPDDLKVVEGIGPKIASLLQAGGIATFAQLAAADVEQLRAILAQAGLSRLADPATWPEQARLAADGKWEALKLLQDTLKGGRRA